ncbi:hypothetical protein C8Q79DRAFT_918990 [Trametes meyenii]|nr:hypothetical protein C8Q79DRAFT_918990 [Trametes meyenii]
MQSKLREFELYCGANFLLVNVTKTLASVYGPLPDPTPTLYLYSSPIQLVAEATYVGMTFKSTKRDIFAAHYQRKASSAKSIASACFMLESYMGPLPPTLALRLYRARVDPHLTSGCEIALDVHQDHSELLEDLQVEYLRRALNISRRSQIAPLFTETGIRPIRYRRITLALRYLHYILTQRPELVNAALREAFNLAASHSAPTWWSDLCHAAALLPVPVVLNIRKFPSPQDVNDCICAVERSLADHLLAQVMTSQRLPIIQHRLRYNLHEANGHGIPDVSTERAYLRLPTRRLRDAIMQLTFSEHPLAIEQMRRTPGHTPREWRVCRFCRHPWAIETETHVLLECAATVLSTPRKRFLDAAVPPRHSLHRLQGRLTKASLLDAILRSADALPHFAELAATVFELCRTSHPLLRIQSEAELLSLVQSP